MPIVFKRPWTNWTEQGQLAGIELKAPGCVHLAGRFGAPFFALSSAICRRPNDEQVTTFNP